MFFKDNKLLSTCVTRCQQGESLHRRHFEVAAHGCLSRQQRKLRRRGGTALDNTTVRFRAPSVACRERSPCVFTRAISPPNPQQDTLPLLALHKPLHLHGEKRNTQQTKTTKQNTTTHAQPSVFSRLPLPSRAHSAFCVQEEYRYHIAAVLCSAPSTPRPHSPNN